MLKHRGFPESQTTTLFTIAFGLVVIAIFIFQTAVAGSGTGINGILCLHCGP